MGTQPRARRATHALGIAAALAVLIGAAAAGALEAGAATPARAAEGPGTVCDLWGCADDQPRLSTPVPAAAPTGAFAAADFDRDGVANSADNCLLVPNADQRPARRPAGSAIDPLAAEWKKAHPAAAFRTNAQLGEACSGWNGNWRRTEEAQLLAPEPVKQQLFRYLGEGGPMFGDDRLAYGGPVCSDLNTGWIHMGEYFTGFPQSDMPMPRREFGCPDGTMVGPFTDGITAHVWGGKRLFTPTNAGGTITNRFFPSMTEHPMAAPFEAAAPETFVRGRPQTVLGHVIRGRSYVDGRPTTIMDWRRSTGAGVNGYPVANPDVPGFGSFLVYDECRGLQEGVWTCNANADIVKPGGDRRLFQFGWMMWQTIDPDIARWEAWERANPRWTRPAAYGFTDTAPDGAPAGGRSTATG